LIFGKTSLPYQQQPTGKQNGYQWFHDNVSQPVSKFNPQSPRLSLGPLGAIIRRLKNAALTRLAQ
jgi:hypothetical protein